MRIYILDDDINIIRILRNIVELDFNRLVVGSNNNPVKAVDEIISLKPDAVLIDYLMPDMDGVDVIRKVKAITPKIEFIMLSQISDKEMIGEAYLEGISFFISKPINKNEVNVVLSNLENRISSSEKLKQIMSLVGNQAPVEESKNLRVETAEHVLRDLGVYGEKGAKDMIEIIEIMEMNRILEYEEAFDLYCKKADQRAKSVRQRMRRAAGKALKNIAYLGIEDYMSETFVKYSSSLFSFNSVKIEMDFARGNSLTRGSISIHSFMENLSNYKS